jgi:hypothetical protein
MRAALLLLAACGRIGFDARIAGDGGGFDAMSIGDGSADAAGPQWSHLTAYADQTCALFGTDAYCWGNIGIDGQATMTSALPFKYSDTGATAIGPGESFVCVIGGGGMNCHGQTPGLLTSFASGPVTAVSGGRGFACLIAGDVRCWGTNSVGQLGVGDMNTRTMPTSTGLIATRLRCGDDHCCALSTSGPMCWGHNDNGTLGNGSTSPAQSTTPIPVTGGIASLPIIAGWHACALTGGSAFCWGRGSEGELGNGANSDSPSPISIVAATYVATGGGPTDYDASCVVSGTPKCWGANAYGRLGNGLTANSNVPVDVMGLPSSATTIEMAIGYDHACALMSDGDIWCWGRGSSGQLGDGLMTDSLSPVKVTKP